MYEALKNFSGVVSMSVGDVRDIEDVNIVKDLLRAGYIREIKPAKKGEEVKKETTEETVTETVKSEKKPARSRAKRG